MKCAANDQASTSCRVREESLLVNPTNRTNLIWRNRTETLYFQLGRRVFARAEFPALTLASPPFLIGDSFCAPTAEAFAARCEVVACPSLPVCRDLPTLQFRRGTIRYVPHRGTQFYIEFKGTFEDYLKGWSRQSRYKIRRDVRRFRNVSGGTIDCRTYRSAAEISKFYTLAVSVSRRSRHYSSGIGLRESAESETALLVDAASSNVEGYLLFFSDQPIAYALCRIYEDVVTYAVAGYDADFADHRPGAILLYLMIEKLYAERRFRIFDFTAGTDYYAYKEQFASGRIRCARVLWFRPSFRNLSLVLANCVTMAVWESASRIRSTARAFNSYVAKRREREVRARANAVGTERGTNKI